MGLFLVYPGCFCVPTQWCFWLSWHSWSSSNTVVWPHFFINTAVPIISTMLLRISTTQTGTEKPLIKIHKQVDLTFNHTIFIQHLSKVRSRFTCHKMFRKIYQDIRMSAESHVCIVYIHKYKYTYTYIIYIYIYIYITIYITYIHTYIYITIYITIYIYITYILVHWCGRSIPVTNG